MTTSSVSESKDILALPPPMQMPISPVFDSATASDLELQLCPASRLDEPLGILYGALVALMLPLTLLGVLSNALAIAVLARARRATNRQMTLLLQALSAGNTVMLAFAVACRSITDLYCFTNPYASLSPSTLTARAAE